MSGNVQTGAGTRVYIGTKLSANLTDDPVSDLAAMKAPGITYTEIGELITIGDYGDSVGDANYTALARARVTHLKGVADGGTTDLTIAFDKGDAGQLALVAAQADRSAFHHLYPFKVVYPDGATDFFAAVVQGNRKQPGDGGSVVQRSVTIGLNSAVLEDA